MRPVFDKQKFEFNKIRQSCHLGFYNVSRSSSVATVTYAIRVSSQKVQEKVETPEAVEVQVGSKEALKIFIVDRSLLLKHSKYFWRKCQHRSGYEDETVFFKSFEPLNFEMFLQWTVHPAPSISYDPDMDQPQEPWLSNAATTWLLGKMLECSDDFDRYALSQFIQNCAFMAFGPWELIEKEVPKGSLRLFSNHWVAWNYRLAGPDPNEYSGLRAAIRSNTPVRDPRIFDIEHWYSECGRYRQPRCLHDPIARQEKIREASQPKPFPPAKWGRSGELQREVCSIADTSNIWKLANFNNRANDSVVVARI